MQRYICFFIFANMRICFLPVSLQSKLYQPFYLPFAVGVVPQVILHFACIACLFAQI